MTSFSVLSTVIERFSGLPKEWHSYIHEFARVLTRVGLLLPSHEVPEQPLAVEGMYEDGVVKLPQKWSDREGQRVIVTFLEEGTQYLDVNGVPKEAIQSGYDGLDEILTECQVSTGIGDLASQHDHYRHGIPKRD